MAAWRQWVATMIFLAALCLVARHATWTVGSDIPERSRSLAAAGQAGEWLHVGHGQPLFGRGSGDCTGCHSPIQTAVGMHVTPEQCQQWVDQECPNTPDRPRGCPGANALGFRVGWWSGASHECRAWVCDDAPGANHDSSWTCFRRTDASPPTTTASGSTGGPTSTVPVTSVTSTTTAPSTSATSSSTTAPSTTTTSPSTSTTAATTTATSSTIATSPPPPTTTSATSTTSPRLRTNTTTPRPTPQHDHCTEHPDKSYKLDWRSVGKTFFDDWTFKVNDYNNGAVDYLSHDEAVQDKVVEAHDTHAILRTGSRSAKQQYKRNSAKIQSNRAWTYFLMTMKFSHVPWGCGTWPAFWTHAPHTKWPEGGEMDILEYVNDLPSQTSFHTGESNKCKMDGGVVNMPFCEPMPDLNGMNYDCTTEYPLRLGCAPNKLPVWSPFEWAHNPGVVAVQWTERFLKMFYIPEAEIPAELENDHPNPDGWDRWLVSWYPFALSNERWPGTCPNPEQVMKPQQLVININFCGDWAAKVWPMSGSCVNRVGPHFPLQCRAVDPLLETNPNATAEDCCTQFIWDEDGQFGADQYLAERAYFNISWIKVYSPQE